MEHIRDTLKKTLKEKGIKEVGKSCFDWLVEHGYLYSELLGWEKAEVYERFNLSPNITAVPCYYTDETDYKEKRMPITDEYGKRTGEYQMVKHQFFTGKKVLAINENYLNYMRWKKEKDINFIKQQMALDGIAWQMELD